MTALLVDRIGTAAVLTMHRPEQRNALDSAMREALSQALHAIRADAAVLAVVLTGAGGHFCAGGDVKDMGATVQPDALQTRRNLLDLHRWFDELVDMEKPVIAAVDGSAFSAGLSLALAADFISASPRARFCSVFARIGLVPDAGQMHLLPRAVGLARAKDMVFSARVVDADEALRIGLVHTVVVDDVRSSALAFAARFHNAPTEAIGLAKSVMNRAFESERHHVHTQEAMAQAVARGSAFHGDAGKRFMAKEPSRYTWPEAPTPTAGMGEAL